MSKPDLPAPVPRTFVEYVRSFGPGIVVVLTWLGAGDVVDMAIAGSSYGYALMWVLVGAVVMRFLFVSRIAHYQLCNQHGEGVLDGLARLHAWYAPGLFFAAIVMGHVDCSYMAVGCGEVMRNLFGFGSVWQWAFFCNGTALMLVLRPSYSGLELLFKIFLAVLSISFVGTAIWVGFNPAGVLQGMFRLEMPGQQGHFSPALVAVAMIGAVGGSLMNLVYPYFLAAKGWKGSQYLRVQFYDFALAIFVMIVLNLAVWTLGAELLYPDKHIRELDDLPRLLTTVLGEGGRWLFYLGIFAAIYTSLVGHAAGLGSIASHALLRWRTGKACGLVDFQSTATYRKVAVWCLVSSLVWVLPGMPDFVSLTLIANSAKVVLLPVLAGGIWWITASRHYIGPDVRNRWWDNVVMGILFVLAVYGAGKAVQSLWKAVT